MFRKIFKVRLIVPFRGDYVDRTVFVQRGREGERPRVIRYQDHDHYRLVAKLSSNAVEGGFDIPQHDKVYIDHVNFTFHFLRKLG